MKTIIKLALTIVVLFTCYTAIQLLRGVAQPGMKSVNNSSEVYFIYKTPDVPVYKGNGVASSRQGAKSTMTPAASPWSSSSSMLSNGKGNVNSTSAHGAIYKNDVLVPSIDTKRNSSQSVAMGYGESGTYAAVGRRSAIEGDGGASASYGLAGRLAMSTASAGLLYADPVGPIDPDNLLDETPPDPDPDDSPVHGGIGVLLTLAVGYLGMMIRRKKALRLEC